MDDKSSHCFDAFLIVGITDDAKAHGGKKPIRLHCFPAEANEKLPKNIEEFCLPDCFNMKKISISER